MTLSIADVEAAAAAIAPAIPPTPSAPSPMLSELTGADVVVKFENLQFTGSFKERGALNRLLQLDADKRRRGVIAMSAGNHAQALAHHAGRLGIAATIVMPRTTAFVKVRRTEQLGARVILEGKDLTAAHEHALGLAGQERLVYVSPYDDAGVIAGQGTVAIELLERHPDLEVLVVPAGGGGLLAGIATVYRARAPHVEIVGVQAAECTALLAALQGRPAPPLSDTVADGIAVPRPGVLPLAILTAGPVEMLTVDEPSLERAIAAYLEVEHVVAEGAGAASLAALLQHPGRFRGRRTGLVLSGANIDPRLLASVITRSLFRSGNLARIEVSVHDTPGNLAMVAAVLGDHGANIVDVVHRRDLASLHLKLVEVDLTIETRDEDHLRDVLAALRTAGVQARRALLDG